MIEVVGIGRRFAGYFFIVGVFFILFVSLIVRCCPLMLPGDKYFQVVIIFGYLRFPFFGVYQCTVVRDRSTHVGMRVGAYGSETLVDQSNANRHETA